MSTWLKEFAARGPFLLAVLMLMAAFPPKVSMPGRMLGNLALGFCLYAAGYSHGRHGE